MGESRGLCPRLGTQPLQRIETDRGSQSDRRLVGSTLDLTKVKILSNVALRKLEKETGNHRMKSITEISKPNRTSAAATTGRLFFLEASGGRIHSANADGSDRKVIVIGCPIPDGIVVDVDAGHIYWTNMGVPNRNDGSIERADLDGQNRVTIVAEGATFTPKQLHLERKSGKLYWCDREGMRVMRANLDGSKSKLWSTQAKATRGREPI